MRYVLEATWRGYRSSHDRPCHREVITKPEAYEGLALINFTDGTPLCKRGAIDIMDIQ